MRLRLRENRMGQLELVTPNGEVIEGVIFRSYEIGAETTELGFNPKIGAYPVKQKLTYNVEVRIEGLEYPSVKE